MLPVQRQQRRFLRRLAVRLRPLQRADGGQPHPPVLAGGQLTRLSAIACAVAPADIHLAAAPLAVAALAPAGAPLTAAPSPQPPAPPSKRSQPISRQPAPGQPPVQQQRQLDCAEPPDGHVVAAERRHRHLPPSAAPRGAARLAPPTPAPPSPPPPSAAATAAADDTLRRERQVVPGSGQRQFQLPGERRQRLHVLRRSQSVALANGLRAGGRAGCAERRRCHHHRGAEPAQRLQLEERPLRLRHRRLRAAAHQRAQPVHVQAGQVPRLPRPQPLSVGAHLQHAQAHRTRNGAGRLFWRGRRRWAGGGQPAGAGGAAFLHAGAAAGAAARAYSVPADRRRHAMRRRRSQRRQLRHQPRQRRQQ